MSENLVVGFIGNPNCGKTTLFNAFTGANLKVANWPGVTVEKVEGALKYHNNTYRLVDCGRCIFTGTKFVFDAAAFRAWKAGCVSVKYDGYCGKAWNGN